MSIEPILFGDSERPLFGMYHESEAPAEPDRGVVLAYPLGHEYLYAYTAFQKLALRLARAGLSLLRFDYYGTGDSAGESGEGTLELWRDDLKLAVEELTALSGARRISLVGLRLGASLAALASESLPVERLVLWEPIVHGRAYLEELRETQSHFLERSFDEPPDVDGAESLEVVGYPISSRLLAELDGLSLDRLERAPGRVLILSGQLERGPEELGRRWAARGSDVVLERYRGPRSWDWEHGVEEAFLPLAAIHQITGFLAS